MMESALSTERKVAIIGYTDSKQHAPWQDPTWEKWGINDLHHWIPTEQCSRWYDLHPIDGIRNDPQHMQWLQTTTLPVFMWEAQSDLPMSIEYPKTEVTARFGRYFTNSISWMIAHALYEGVTHLGIWGVDMAQGTEYAAQRPSCEYFIGMAAGMGIQVFIPEQSDLIKSANLYGAEDDSALRAKLLARDAELRTRLEDAQQQRAQSEAAINQLTGAIEQNTYILGVWMQPHAQRDGQEPQSVVPAVA